MAGKRQHYIPRFLQRGFLHHGESDADRTWLSRRGSPSKLVSIRHVGVEDWFYSRASKDGAQSLDDAITAVEGPYSADLEELRRLAPGSRASPALAAPLVSHLVLRTAHIRQIMAQGVGLIADEVTALLTNASRLRQMLGVDDHHPSDVIEQAIDSAMAGLPPDAGFPPPLMRRLLLAMLREQFEATLAPALQGELGDFAALGDMSAKIRDAHNDALSAGRSEEGWSKTFAEWEWDIVRSEDAILPDCVALAFEPEAGWMPFFLAAREQTEAVVLALAPDRLLLGRPPITDVPPLENYRTDAAASSESLFIAATEDAGRSLSGLIGSRSSGVLARGVSGVLASLTSKSSGRNQTVSLRSASGSTEQFSFEVSFVGWDDQTAVGAVSEIVASVVRELARGLPYDTLDGITFAYDYADALRSLNRGDPDLPPIQPGQRQYGQGVGQAVTVRRGGVSKVRIVVLAACATMLISDDEDERLEGLHLLVKLLSYVPHTVLYEEPLNAEFGLQVPDDLSDHLRGIAAVAPSGFFTSRAAAFARPEAGERFAELVLDSLSAAQEAVREARLAYRLDGDLDRLLAVAYPSVSYVLQHAAEWLGHRDGLPEDGSFPGDDLPTRLQTFGLDSWIELLGRDLRRIYGDPEVVRLDDVRALDRHAERLLWTMQIFPWPQEGGGIYVSVPYGDDENLLAARGLGAG